MPEFQTSIHLVVYNGAPWLKWCLESIERQTYQDFFLLIIDNGSIDRSTDIITNFLASRPLLASRARLVRNKQNIGFARAHNQAMAWTKSDYVMILNQDTYLRSDYLALLVNSLQNNERAGAASGKILYWPFNEETFHATDFSKLKKNYIDSLGLEIRRSRRVLNRAQGEEDSGQQVTPWRIFGVAGTVPLYRRAALMSVSLSGEIFDEDFVSYKEDVDLAWRLNLGGWQAWLEPAAVAYHDRSLRAGRGLWQEYKIRKKRARDLKVYSWVNHLAVLIKNDGWFNLARDLPWILGHELAKDCFLLMTDPLTLFKAKWRFFRLLGRFWRKRLVLKTSHKISYQELRRWWSRV